MTSPANRAALYDQLTEVLGVDHARTLMSYLPDDQPATRADLTQTRTELKTDMKELRSELKSDMAELRSELKTDIAELRTELKTDIAELRTEIKTDIGDLRGELRADLRHLNERMAQLADSLAAQTRTFVVASLGSAVTVAGFVFIAVQLV
ncbi:hypothetical protein BH23ACT5_BH23ACT5_19780 [soil metagenome]